MYVSWLVIEQEQSGHELLKNKNFARKLYTEKETLVIKMSGQV